MARKIWLDGVKLTELVSDTRFLVKWDKEGEAARIESESFSLKSTVQHVRQLRMDDTCSNIEVFQVIIAHRLVEVL